MRQILLTQHHPFLLALSVFTDIHLLQQCSVGDFYPKSNSSQMFITFHQLILCLIKVCDHSQSFISGGFFFWWGVFGRGFRATSRAAVAPGKVGGEAHVARCSHMFGAQPESVIKLRHGALNHRHWLCNLCLVMNKYESSCWLSCIFFVTFDNMMRILIKWMIF